MIRRLARPLLSAIFVTGGLDALRSPGPRVQMTETFAEKVSEMTGFVPNDPDLLVRMNGAIMAISGLMLATGKAPRVASLALAGSTVPTTLVGHAFWNESDKSARAGQRTQFMKNLGLIGGLLLAAVDTEGKPGLAWRAANATKVAKREARIAKAQAKLALS